MSTSSSSGYQLYRYDPSLAAAAIFTVIFALLGIAHIFRVVQGRIYYFLVFTFGIGLEFGGYIARIASAEQAPNFKLIAYIIQSLFLLLAPAFFAASIYMTLGRLIRAARAESLSMISTKWLTKIFVSGDVISFLTQGAGGGLMATAGGMQTGSWIIVGGLVIQLVYLAVFLVVAGAFHSRAAKTSLLSRELRFQLVVLYLACALILLRSIVRLVEFAQGNAGYIISHEAFLYVFDALPMAVVVALYVAFPPFFHADKKRVEADVVPMQHQKLASSSDVEYMVEGRR